MDSSINYNEWYKLDNAAKIFPAVSREDNSNIFRISAQLKDSVEPELLQRALETALPRFPSFAARLRRGFFWYFLDHNTNKPIVRQEPFYLFKKMRPSEENGYLFRVFYYGKRISLEMFHSLSDGFGAFEFMKSILFHYFELAGKTIRTQNKVKTAASPYELRELEDSFFINYEKSSLSAMKGEPAYHIPGVPFLQGGSGLISGQCDSDAFNALAKSHGATVGEFIIAAYVQSILQAQPDTLKSKKAIVILVPVNLRRFFNSNTLRNFVSSASIKVPVYKTSYTFGELLALVQDQMRSQLNKKLLSEKMSGPVTAERIIFFRILPLFLKIPILKICFKIFGEKLTTSSVSNMGRVELPDDMAELVENFDFSMAATMDTRINIGVGSYNGKLNITFSRTIVETNIIRNFFTFLSKQLDFHITTNSWEEDNFYEKPCDTAPKKLTSAEKKAARAEKKAARAAIKAVKRQEKPIRKVKGVK